MGTGIQKDMVVAVAERQGEGGMTTQSDMPKSAEELRDFVLMERDKGNAVLHGLPGQLIVAPVEQLVSQHVDGLLYDLNRLEEISLTFLGDPKWVNDFAVALVIRKLHGQLAAANERIAQVERDAERVVLDVTANMQSIIDSVVSAKKVAESRCDKMDGALKQASLCLREFLPDNKDARLTVRIIDAALRR